MSGSLTLTLLDKLRALALDVGQGKAPTAYLAGPMRGLPEFNFPEFHAAAAILRRSGWGVFSPAERDLEDAEALEQMRLNRESGEWNTSLSLAHYMEFDLPAVCQADAVVLLPGWEDSVGAKLEVHVAFVVGKRVFTLDGAELKQTVQS